MDCFTGINARVSPLPLRLAPLRLCVKSSAVQFQTSGSRSSRLAQISTSGNCLRKHLGQPLDGKPLAGEMAGQEQPDARRLGLQTGVKPGLAQDHASQPAATAAESSSPAAPQATATVRTGCAGIAHHLQPLDRQELLQRGRPVAPAASGSSSQPQRPAPWPSAARRQGHDAPQPQAGRQPLIDPLGGRVEGGVRAVDGHAGGNQLQQQPAGRGLGRQALQGGERQGVMGDDQVGPAPQRPRRRWPG